MSLRNVDDSVGSNGVFFCENYQENKRMQTKIRIGHITITLLLVTIWIISDSITWALIPIAIAAWWIGHYTSCMLFKNNDLPDCSTQISCISQCPLDYPDWCPHIKNKVK